MADSTDIGTVQTYSYLHTLFCTLTEGSYFLSCVSVLSCSRVWERDVCLGGGGELSPTTDDSAQQTVSLCESRLRGSQVGTYILTLESFSRLAFRKYTRFLVSSIPSQYKDCFSSLHTFSNVHLFEICSGNCVELWFLRRTLKNLKLKKHHNQMHHNQMHHNHSCQNNRKRSKMKRWNYSRFGSLVV